MELWRDPRLAHWAGWVVLLLAVILYLVTLDNGLRPDELGGGDLITHQYAQVQARPSNAPGYPLYTMGGWLWYRLTGPLLGWVLNPLQRLSSYSTLWALLTLYVLYRLILRVTRGNWMLAALSSLFYAVSYFFWYYSVTTEQYTMAVFQTLLVVYLAFVWDDDPQRGNRTLLWLALVVGSCAANLVTTLFILPPLAWFVLSRRSGVLRQPRLLLGMAGMALLPVLSYAYVYLRGAAHPEWWGEGDWISAWAWFTDFLTTTQGRDELAPGLSLVPFFTDEFPSLIRDELTLPVLVMGVIGLWAMPRRRTWFIAGTVVLYLIFCWVDRFGNWYQVIMPVYPLLVMGMAAGLESVLRDREDSPRMGGRVLYYVIPICLLALVVSRFAVSLPRANQYNRPDATGLDPGWLVLADGPQENSVVVADYEEWTALSYLVDIWGVKPTFHPRPVCQPETPDPGGEVSELYLTRAANAADPGCLSGQHLSAAGTSLIQVRSNPAQQLPAPVRPAVIHFGDGMSLVGYEQGQRPEHPAPDSYQISLYWQSGLGTDVDYTVSVRPLLGGSAVSGLDGQPAIQDHQPVWGAYPTSLWSPGEIVRDDYALTLAPGVEPDGMQVVVYRTLVDDEGNPTFETLGEALVDFGEP